MEEKKDDGTSANKGRKRGACVHHVSCASLGSDVVL